MKISFTLYLSFLLVLTSTQAQNYLMNGTPINDCGGFFLDSGGGSNDYGSNQNFVTTICSDGSTGTHIQLNFSGVDIAATDFLCFHDGPSPADPSLGCSSDYLPGSPFIIQATAANPSGCITVTFSSDGAGQGAGWSAAIECVPSCQLITAVLASSDPEPMPADTGWIDICPGDLVTFSGTGLYPQNGVVYNHSDLTSDFEWAFGDGTFGFGPNASKVYEEPGGYVVQLTITDQFGCKNTNFLSQRVRVATIPQFELSEAPEICVGDTLPLNAVVNADTSSATLTLLPPTEGSFSVEGIRSDSLPLPDGTGASYETSILFTEFSPGQVLTNINDLLGICVVMEHSYLRDLEIEITCPDGTTVTLHNFAGQVGGEVFLGEPFEADEGFNPPIPGLGYEYCWTPNAPNGTWLQYANANNPQTLPEGDYSSFETLNNLLGCPLNGEWTISVQDLWGIDNGYIFSWSINFNPDIYPSIETFTPTYLNWFWDNNPSILTYTPDSITVSPPNAGNPSYTFIVEDDFGCVWDTTLQVNVLPFTHPDCYNCQEIIGPQPDTVACPGSPVQLDVSTQVAAPDVTFEGAPYFPIGFGNSPPNAPYASTIQVNSISPNIITDPATDILSVCFDLQTNFLSDIDVFLVAPDGSILELTSGNGGTSDFYTNTCFTPTAFQPITSGTTPFTGNFLPEGNWNTLAGTPTNGDWTLLVSDDSGPNTLGIFNWWSITFNTQSQVTYTWTPGGTLSCTDCPDPEANPAMPTNYMVDAFDTYGCTATDTVFVNVLPAVPAPMPSCFPQAAGDILFTWPQVDTFTLYQVNINGTGWVPANGNLEHLVTGLPPGVSVSFQVQAVETSADFCGALVGSTFCSTCLGSALNLGFTPVTCNGECDGTVSALGVGGTAPYTYVLTHEDGLYTVTQTGDGDFTGLCPGLNIVTVTDALGCIDTIQALIAEPPAISLEVLESQSISCFGENDGEATAIATGGAGGFTYQWDDPLAQIQPTATLLFAGPISVEVTDANGCTVGGSAIITEPTPLAVSAGSTNVLCFNGNTGTAQVEVSGGTYPYSYLWDNPGADSDSLVIGLPDGTYTVEVIDANGCMETAVVVITEPSTPVEVTASQTDTSCFNQSQGIAFAEASGGTGLIYSYSWSNGDSGQTADGLATQTYSVTATDANGCEDVATVNISQYPEMEIIVIFSPVSCNGLTDGAMAVNDVTGGSGSGILNYSWSIPASPNAPVLDGLTGNTTYSVTVTDDQGCQAEASAFVPEPEALEIFLTSTDASCFGLNNGSGTVLNVLNAEPPLTYLWSPNAGGQATAAATDLLAGVYTVEVTDANNCQIFGEITITEPPAIELSFEMLPNDCFGDQEGALSVTATGGVGNFTFLWSTNEVAPAIGGLAAGTYTITVTDGNDCEVIQTTEVTAPAPIDPDIATFDVTCFGERDGSIQVDPLGGTPPFLYSLDGQAYSGSSTLIGLVAGEYSIFIQDANGCLWAEEVFISEPPALGLVVTPGLDVTIQLGELIDLNASAVNAIGPVGYIWEAPYEGTLSCIDCPNPTVSTFNTITYDLIGVDSAGCQATVQVTVRVEKERRVVVPTGFSPNGDKENDRLLVHGISGTTITLFQVFDRWGELVYQAENFSINDPLTGWDGSFRGQEMNSGVYLWYLEAQYIDGLKETFKGTTTLIR